MEINVTRTLAIIAICAACTFFERALPFLLFGDREVPKVIRYLGRVLPMAIMTTLIVYCIRDVRFTSLSGWMPYFIGISVTALLHLWKRNSLLSIAGGTAVYMVLVQCVFIP